MATTPLTLDFVNDGPPYLSGTTLDLIVAAINGAIDDAAAAAGTPGGPLSPALIVETATGVWSGDATVRTPGQYPIIFSGIDDPAGLTHGITTPARINASDVWLQKL